MSLGASTYIGVGFRLAVAGRIAGIRAYIGSGVLQPEWGLIWNIDAPGAIRVYHFRQDVSAPAGGWMNTWFRPWVRYAIGDTLRVAVLMGQAYRRNNGALASPVTHSDITYIASFQTTAINPILVSPSSNTNANGVDVLFQPD